MNQDRIELHPATDRWMQGDRIGTVLRSWQRKSQITGKPFTLYRVHLDRSRQRVTVHEGLIQRWL